MARGEGCRSICVVVRWYTVLVVVSWCCLALFLLSSALVVMLLSSCLFCCRVFLFPFCFSRFPVRVWSTFGSLLVRFVSCLFGSFFLLSGSCLLEGSSACSVFLRHGSGVFYRTCDWFVSCSLRVLVACTPSEEHVPGLSAPLTRFPCRALGGLSDTSLFASFGHR